MAVGPDHSPGDGHEQDVEADNCGVKDTVNGELDRLWFSPEDPIGAETESEDGKVQRRVVVMDIGDSCHCNEWEVVEEPSNHWVDTGVVDLVDLRLVEIDVAALPADEIPYNNKSKEGESGGRSPVHEWVTEEEIFDDGIVPAAHTQANVQDRPLPELRGKVILLIRIRHESVVGGCHCDVEMDEVLEEGRFVRIGVSSRYY